jgi:tyrosine-protein kinase Etk/Wzc
MNEFDNYEPENQPINIKEYFYLFLHHWYWIVIGLVVGLAGVYIYLRYAPTIYSVNSVVMITDPQEGGITEEALLGDLGFKTKSLVEDQMEVLKSANLMGKVVDSLGLENSFISKGRVKSSDVYQTFELLRLDSLTTAMHVDMEVVDS